LSVTTTTREEAVVRCTRLMTLITVCALLLTGALAAGATEYEHHAQVRIFIDSPADEAWVEARRAELDILHGRRGEFVDVLVPQSELSDLLAAAGHAELIQADVETYYAERNGNRGDFGAYHTFSEDVAWMDQLRAQYPDVISARWSIGQGHEGNDLWAFRVSDNPDIDESGEAEVLFDGMHHAREIMAAEMPMMLAEYLCQEYTAGNPDIVSLVDDNEIYFVPIVNPDGFLYNEQISPNGGGMWRKNRRNNGGSYGVDPNRNYPYEWGCDWGSSGSPSDETYRGPSPASEPEVQAMIAFINDHDFVTRQSWHSYSELTLYPWGYTTNDTPDEDTFREMAAAMVQYNGYAPGQPGDVLYDVCGGTFDWDYGAQGEHGKIFSFTNEIGSSSDGFWPTDGRRQQLFEDNLWPSLYMIGVSGSLRGVTWEHEALPFTAVPSAGYIVSGTPVGYEGAAIDPTSVKLVYRVDGAGFIEVEMSHDGEGVFTAEMAGQADGAVVEYYLTAADVDGGEGTSPRSAPDALHYFEVGSDFSHDMESARGWISGAAGDDAGTGLWVRVDPVGTAAQPEDDHSTVGTLCWVTGQHEAGESIGFNDVDGGATSLLSPVYDLTGAQEVNFSYWRWYSNDQGSSPGEDYWDVMVSNDGGESWLSLEHTNVSSNAWEAQSFSLLDHFASAGQVQLKFVASDEGSGSIVEGAVDDFNIAGLFDVTGPGGELPPFRVNLERPFPNPFNPKTTIHFTLGEPGFVSLGVFDVAGRMVRSLLSSELSAGEHGLSWNGRDALGRPAASGTYFIRLRAEGRELSRRVVLLK
jgi:carboxypeptidase T